MLFVGSSHGPERRLAENAGIPFQAIPSAPLTKSVSFRNAGALIKLVTGFFKARRIISDFAPGVVIGTGGYTTAAILLAQKSLGGRIVIHEQNAVPGRTNLWLSRIADKVCVSFNSSLACFPGQKVVFTGMPVRAGFAALMDKSQARRKLGLEENLFTVLVVGGSQGAQKVNQLVMDAWPLFDNGNVQVLHQTGERNLPQAEAADISNRERYRVHGYLDMETALAAADMVIGRSGASTLAEINAAGKPCVLIPYPYAYADHQRLNAQAAAENGAGIVMNESDTDSDKLADLIIKLIASPDRLSVMAEKSAAMGKSDAARKIAETALGIYSERN